MINKLRIKFFPKFLLKRFKSKFARTIFLLKQYEGTQKRIWGIELTIKGLRSAREILRREYDKLNEDITALSAILDNSQVTGEKKQKTEELKSQKEKEIEEWKKKIDLSDETLKDLESQISSFRENLELLDSEL